MARQTIMQATVAALADCMREDPNVLLFGQDIGPFGGALQSAAGLWDEFGSRRLKEVPISETAATGLCVGAAMSGLRPVLEIMFAEFLAFSLPSLAEAGSVSLKSGRRLSVPLVVRTKYGVGPHRGHAETSYGFLSTVPGIKMVVPSTPQTAYDLMVRSVQDDDPVIFLEHMGLVHARRAEVEREAPKTKIGEARIVRQGSDLTIVTWGLMVERASKAAELLALDGVSVEVIDLLTLMPMDLNTVLRSIERTGRVLVVDEAPALAGFTSELVSMISERGFSNLKSAPLRLQAPPLPVPYAQELELAYVPSVGSIVKAVNRSINSSRVSDGTATSV